MSKIDESLYSRQLYVLGHEAMNKMLTSKVLLVGHNPLSLEIAKNICLSGVHSLSLIESNQTICEADLGCMYYFNEQDIGKNSVQVLQQRLSELNPYVPLHIVPFSQQSVGSFDVVITSVPSPELIPWTKGKLVVSLVHGLFSSIFCDFGSHHVIDPNGEPCKSELISNILVGETVDFFTVEEHRHHLQVDDVIELSEIKGLDLNHQYKIVAVKSPYSFSINASVSGTYESGGMYTEIKQPLQLEHSSYHDAYNKEILTSDFAKLDRQSTLHCCFIALFNKNLNLTFISQLASQLKVELDNDIVNQFIASKGECAPLYGIIGGLSAQEVLKKLSNKFTPISQWFYFDALELAPTATSSSVLPRYQHQLDCLGQTLVDAQQLNLFLVGAGAIGCELLKNFSMIGIANSKTNSRIVVTDMDTIEKSNLNRQFLFRSWDVGNLKSSTAKQAINKYNSLKIESKSTRVGKETESEFNSEFYSSIDIVCNALDNWDARRYMDGQCVLYNKVLMESGTLGVMGNTQVIIPQKTECFSSSQDPQDQGIPQCTLHNFPNKIEHCIQWARDKFELFDSICQAANTYNSNGTVVEASSLSNALPISTSWEDCVQWARLLFELFFTNNIQQMLHNFPVDTKNDQGVLFWSGPKRAPTPLHFNKEHYEFVFIAACLRAQTCKVVPQPISTLDTILSNMIVPEFVPKQVKIHTEGNKAIDQGDVQLPPSDPSHQFVPMEFEKDVDSNKHVDFVYWMSTLRALNYGITPLNKHMVKKIAGKIIPGTSYLYSIDDNYCSYKWISNVGITKDSQEMSFRPNEERIREYWITFLWI